MRRLIFFVAALVAASAAACGSSASTSDPYELVRRASTATQDQLQVDIGAAVTTGGTTVTLDPGAIRVVMDKPAGKGSFHLSLPAAALKMDAAALAQLGITGATIDLDALWDGQALYAKSPVLATLLTAFAAQGGTTLPSGDLTGWLKLLSKADIDSLSGAASAAPATPGAPTSDAATIKKQLEDAGVTLTLAGTESKNNVSTNHITGTVDSAKLLASPAMARVSGSQRTQIESALKDATITFDLWLDASSNRMVELDPHYTKTGTDAGTASVTIAFSTPSSPDFSAPSGAVEIPTMKLVGQLIQMFGASLGS